MSAHAFGEIAIWFNALSCLAVAAVFGQENLIVRSWAICERAAIRADGRGLSLRWITSGATTLLACLALIVGAIPPNAIALDGARRSARLLAAQAICTILPFLPHDPWFPRLGGQPGAHLAPRSAGRRRAPSAWRSDADDLLWRRRFRHVSVDRDSELGTAASSRPRSPGRGRNSQAGMVRARPQHVSVVERRGDGQYAEVILLGFLVAPAAAATYFIAARVANIFPMIATGLNTYTVTRSAICILPARRSACSTSCAR